MSSSAYLEDSKMIIASIQKIAQKSFKDPRKRALASKVPVVEYENKKIVRILSNKDIEIIEEINAYTHVNKKTWIFECDPSTENRTEKLSYILKRFDVSRRHLIISTMPAFSVIKHFNIIKIEA